MPRSKIQPNKPQPKWANVRLPGGLAEKMDEFLRSDRARELGLRNRAAVVTYVVRELLKKEQYI